MTDHWDHDDFDVDLPDEVHLSEPLADLHPGVDLPDLDLPEADLPEVDLPGLDIADLPEVLPAADVFPPSLDVDLPEPVDGFPWVDTATLGVPDTAGFTVPATPVDPRELAAYAGIEIPPGTDPWTVLAASDDPATAALARFWLS
ncbi:hypothetical protein [Actinoplanes sp. G11-F43]|uniref:hypothetical protein n=1 Tax=Actinoplanes sp. G11-F43 TaxID=3424130 RepID=UPI003D32CF43